MPVIHGGGTPALAPLVDGQVLYGKNGAIAQSSLFTFSEANVQLAIQGVPISGGPALLLSGGTGYLGIQLASPHNGGTIQINGSGGPSADGRMVITGFGTTGDFSFEAINSGAYVFGGAGAVTTREKLLALGISSMTAPVFIVRGGASPGAGGHIQTWQKSDTTVVAAVDATGQIGSGLVPSDQLSVKKHAAFAGSEYNQSTGAVQTTDATPTVVFSKTLADNTLYWFEALVIGRDTSGAQRAFYIRSVRVHRQGGAATLGTVQTPVTDESDAVWDATFTVSSNDVRVSVTGKLATTINWTVTVRYQAVSGNA